MQSRDTVPWKVRRYDDAERVLAPADLNALSANHDLDREDLDSLAAQLTIRLDERRRFRREDLVAPQQQRGLNDLDGALADLEAGSKRLERALNALNGLHFNHPFAHTGMPNPANAQLAALDEALASLRSTQGWLERVRKTGGVMSRAPADRRKLRDERRRLVCSALFDFWIGSGRAVSYTTNTLSSEREGPLIRFVNDVVRHLTDPSRVLAGDAIKLEIEAYRSARTDTEPKGPRRHAQHIDREAERVLQGIEAAAIEPAARFLLLLSTITARNQMGISEQRATDLRLAMRLAAALLERSSTPSEKAMALTASAAAKSALARMVWDLDLLEAAAADLREALALVDTAETTALRTEILLSHAGTLAALDAMNDRIPTDDAINAYMWALKNLEKGGDALRRAHVRTIIAVALARRETLPDLAAAEAHLRYALADLQGHDAPKPLVDIAHNLALVLSKMAALKTGNAEASEVAFQRSETAESLGELVLIEKEEEHLRGKVAELGRLPRPYDQARVILNLAQTLFRKALASGSSRPLDEAADHAVLSATMFEMLGENDAASEATMLLLDIHNQQASAEEPGESA
jgi:hypothetical protein